MYIWGCWFSAVENPVVEEGLSVGCTIVSELLGFEN
jgi:hypothetical protein